MQNERVRVILGTARNELGLGINWAGIRTGLIRWDPNWELGQLGGLVHPELHDQRVANPRQNQGIRRNQLLGNPKVRRTAAGQQSATGNEQRQGKTELGNQLGHLGLIRSTRTSNANERRTINERSTNVTWNPSNVERERTTTRNERMNERTATRRHARGTHLGINWAG